MSTTFNMNTGVALASSEGGPSSWARLTETHQKCNCWDAEVKVFYSLTEYQFSWRIN